MNADEKIIAEAVRVEFDETTGKVFIVFEAVDPKFKRDVITEWIKDLEFKIKGKLLIQEEE
jgi:hypothetical protein